jgi:hypothetical protein
MLGHICLISPARSGPLRPSMRIRTTDGESALVTARNAWKHAGYPNPLPVSEKQWCVEVPDPAKYGSSDLQTHCLSV